MPRLITIILLFLSGSFSALGQDAAVYNINKYNGLSSNHVYCTLVDQYGYLWIGTTDGLFRYNGYALRKYDYADGLPNTDIWSLYEDSSGRIWLGSIAQQIGYIKDYNYKRVYKNVASKLTEIYPSALIQYQDKIAFINITTNKIGQSEVGIIKDDTLIDKVLLVHSGNSNISFYQPFDNYVVEVLDSHMYVFNKNKWLETPTGTLPVPEKIYVTDYNLQEKISREPISVSFADKYYTYYKPTNNTINFLNIHTAKTQKYILPHNIDGTQRKLVFCYVKKNELTVITDKTLLKIDSNLNITYTKPLDSFLNGSLNGFDNTYFTIDTFWGDVLATNNLGLFISYTHNSLFEKVNADLTHYQFINRLNDSLGYWWNNNNNILAIVENGRIVSSAHLPDVYKVKKIIKYSSEKSILINQNRSAWLNNNNTIQAISSGVKRITLNGTKASKNQLSNFSDYAIDAIVFDSNIYILGSATIGSYKLSFEKNVETMHIKHFDYGRFRSITYNKKFHIILCHSHDKVLIVNPQNNKKIFLDQKKLEALGLKGIEKIVIDDYGNIIIKDFNSVHIYNLLTKRVRTIFNSYKLEKAILDVHNNTLSLAGSFGVIQCNIGETGKISNKKLYPNIKNTYYRFVSDAQFSEKNVLLKTDNGFFLVNTTNQNNHINLNNDFRLILNNQNKLHNLNSGDTLSIKQTTTAIGIDVIKPTGTGNLNIQYSINGNAATNSGYQLIIPKLNPGSYNTISVTASDDSWRSKPISFVIFIEPKWWQTTFASRTIFLLIFLLLIGVVYFAIVITKRIVTRNNNKRNQRRELELKSIYSQINPHFIFNSLSTALYFVKKNKTKEAYEHINQFSDLLRSYIKSSRNKYISITEELINLENYLQLQLTRFEAKFEYTFNIDDSVNPKQLKIPSLLLQPLVENALNHGIFHSTEKGLLIISFTYDSSNDSLTCIIDDNGIGRKKSKEIRSDMIKKADSYGTILIKELIDTFNKYEKINIELEYLDKIEPQTGTTVVINIKNITHAQ